MKVVIVAKTRMGSGACVGAVSFDGQSLRLLAPDDAVENGHFNLDYNVGDVWDVTHHKPREIIPPHVESIVVTEKRRLPSMGDLCRFIENQMPPVEGGVDVLFDGLVQATRYGAQYIAERTGIPVASTMFWRPDRPLTRVVDESVRIRYCYPSDEDNRTLTFVGFQEPPDAIPAGTLLRVSLAHWWRPQDKPDDELRCYVQLSGWYPDCGGPSILPGGWTTSHTQATPLARKWDMAGAEDQLRRVFGYESFRPAQQRIISNMAARQDTLAVMPTGSGKSLCYQLPATLFPGLTVVVSPLIALMEDQVVQLRELNIPAAFLNSSLPYEAQINVMRQARQGRIQLLYVAPETLLKPEIMQLLTDTPVDCLAIDEAHCISEWGHDFRPEYRLLGDVRRRLPQAVCLALTATATPRVRQDIKDSLGIAEGDEIVTSFNRENLYLAARERNQGRQQLSAFLEGHRGESGLIYCLTRNEVDQLTASLQAAGYPAIPYHAGLDNDTRRLHHHRFTYEEDAIVVATIAFGMGINKSNVRFVVHYGTPKDLESYYQQIGRAGRDGLQADCLLLYSQYDIQTAKYHIGNLPPEQQTPAAVRLREMTDFAETSRCRRRPLLRYFDEAFEPDNCGMCDNCLAGPQETIDLTIPAQKFLSCVKRTGEMFGPSYIIDILRGSKARRIVKNGHDQLSTHNIGREYSKQQWQSLVRQFIEGGLLRRDPNHGGLSISAAGTAVLRGESFAGTAPEGKPAFETGPVSGLDFDRELFELLRTKRRELAAQQDVPAFVVFSDRTLQEMATYRPQTIAQLLNIHGFGESKLARYGAAMLSILQPYCEARSLESCPRTVTQRPRVTGSAKEERRQSSARLFAEGRTIGDIADALAVQRDTVIGHLWKTAHFPPGVNESYLCREVNLDPQLVGQLFAQNDGAEIDDLRGLYETQEQITGETEWLLRLLLSNRAMKHKPEPSERWQIRETVLECVKSLPGELPRSGLAGLLRGVPSGRIVEFQDHPACGQYPDEAYFELMAVIDAMIDDGSLALSDNRRLYPTSDSA